MRLFGDLRYAFRTLRKSPGFTLIAMLSLALGIGANAAMFSFVDALVFRPLPVRNSGSIVALHSTAPGAQRDGVSYPDYADLRDQTRTLQSCRIVRFSTGGDQREPRSAAADDGGLPGKRQFLFGAGH